VPLTECVNMRRSGPGIPVSECRHSYTATEFAAWSDFACHACICIERCEDDDDCLPRDAPVPPRCITSSADTDFSLCLLVCEGDDDCPTDMFCLPSQHVAVSACYFVWEKPQCCEEQRGQGC